jgi:hypothetical protein
MDIVFSGICCFVDSALPSVGKTVVVVNALRGGTHQGNLIPPHYGFLHAKREHVDTRNWGSGWLASDDNVLLWLTGDRITIDPMPRGGSIDISQLPHVAMQTSKESICPAAAEIRQGFRDNPSAFNVLALIDLPADAPVASGANDNGAVFATLHIDDAPVTITATPFDDSSGVSRSITVLNRDAHVFVANVDIDSYLLGDTAPDDNHKYLVCEMFRPRLAASAMSFRVRPRANLPSHLARVDGDASQHNPADRVSVGALRRAAGRGMPHFLSTFAAGCSNSQWP